MSQLLFLKTLTMTEESIGGKYGVVISKPPGSRPTGITVLLPGTLLKLARYASTRDALLAQKQLVIGFKTLNPLPLIGKSHPKMAKDVRDVVNAVCNLDDSYKPFRDNYNIVGHSLGGKVALMVAAKYDQDNVNVVIAMDPVDDKPMELTYPRDKPKTNLRDATAKEIHLMQSELGGQGVCPLASPKKNATVIKDLYPDKITSFTMNKGAKHMSYLDSEKDEASKAARDSARTLIKARIMVVK